MRRNMTEEEKEQWRERLFKAVREVNEKVRPWPPLRDEESYIKLHERELREVSEVIDEMYKDGSIPSQDYLTKETRLVLEALRCSPFPPVHEKPLKTRVPPPPGYLRRPSKKKGDITLRTPPENKTGKSASQIVKECIEEGTWTKKQIEDYLAGFGYSRGTGHVLVCHACSRNKQKFDRLAYKLPDGRIQFYD